MTDLTVSRYGILNPVTGTVSGDFLRVGDVDLGETRDIVDAEYKRAGSAYKMRPMFYTGSPFGAEILELARNMETKP